MKNYFKKNKIRPLKTPEKDFQKTALLCRKDYVLMIFLSE